jgi:hypothetical protein
MLAVVEIAALPADKRAPSCVSIGITIVPGMCACGRDVLWRYLRRAPACCSYLLCDRFVVSAVVCVTASVHVNGCMEDHQEQLSSASSGQVRGTPRRTDAKVSLLLGAVCFVHAANP